MFVKRLLIGIGILSVMPVQLSAQSLLWWQYSSLTVQNQWFANQQRVSTPYTQSSCLVNGGVYTAQRLYLRNDQDADGLKDYQSTTPTFHLKDNMLYQWNNANTYRVALITPRGVSLDGGASTSVWTTVYYYTPSTQTNMFSLRANNIVYPIDTNRAWYRFSKVAPLNQPVRAITSEAVLFEQPSSLIPANDRFVQIAYQIRYATYRSQNSNATSNYQVFPVANMSDFSSLGSINSWYMENPIPHNAGLGPIWSSDYQNTDVSITTPAINWWPEATHGLECINYYQSRCWDGYIDVSGQQPTNGSTVQPYTISDLNVSEQCDPWSNLSSWSDDVMPNWATPTATYNCSSTCNIINTPIDPVITYTKTVRNVTTNSNGWQFVEADTAATAVIVNTWDFVQYQITVSKVWGPANNVIVVDNLPINNGFIMTGYSINWWPIVSATFLPSLGIDAQLNAGNVTITLYWYVGNPTANVFLNGAMIFDSWVPVNTLAPWSNNAWTRLPDFVSTPMLRIEKYWIDPNNMNLTWDVYTVAPNTPIKFILRVRNIWNVSAIGIITDVCPTNLNCQTYRILPSLFNQTYSNTISVWSIPVGWYVDVEVTAVAFTDAISTSLINTAQLYINSVNPSNFMNEDSATLNTTRTADFDVIKSVVSGSIDSWSLITYRIEFRNTWNTPITSYTISDNLPSTIQYVPNTARLNGTIFVNPTILGNLLTRWCNIAGNISLNGQSVCPLQSGMSGFITFDALVL